MLKHISSILCIIILLLFGFMLLTLGKSETDAVQSAFLSIWEDIVELTDIDKAP